jgi:hypothetical protein
MEKERSCSDITKRIPIYPVFFSWDTIQIYLADFCNLTFFTFLVHYSLILKKCILPSKYFFYSKCHQIIEIITKIVTDIFIEFALASDFHKSFVYHL